MDRGEGFRSSCHIRYASVYGTGLVELQKYGEALGPLDEAIKVSKDKPEVAYPTIAMDAKIEALSGLGRNQEALALASEAMQRSASVDTSTLPEIRRVQR